MRKNLREDKVTAEEEIKVRRQDRSILKYVYPLFCFLKSVRLWSNDNSSRACALQNMNIYNTICWEDCFWAAGTSLHTAVSFSQAGLMLPVFLIPGAVCGQRAWRLELSGPCLRRQALSPSLAHPQFHWLPPSPPPPPPLLLPQCPQPAGQHGSSNRCFDKCF